jgi:Domain of unknown function (DUF427)
MAVATWNGTVIAESDKTVVVEGNHYFPPESVNTQYLRQSTTTSGVRGRALRITIRLSSMAKPIKTQHGITPSPPPSPPMQPRPSRATSHSGKVWM